MPLTDDDAELATQLRSVLAERGATWIADEVDAARADGDVDDDLTLAEALVLAIARSVAPVPSLLHEADRLLGGLAEYPDPDPTASYRGVVLGGGADASGRRSRVSILRPEIEELEALFRHAQVLTEAADQIEGRGVH